MDYLFAPLITLIDPSLMPVAEKEFHAFLPQDVWLSTCRVPFFEPTQAGLNNLIKNIADMTEMLTSIPIDLIVVNSMTGTCMRGADLRNLLQQRTGVPTITAAQTVLETLKQQGWTRVRIVSNFNPELTFVEKTFFISHDIKVDILNVHEKRNSMTTDLNELSFTDMNRLLATLAETDFSDVDVVLFDAPYFDLSNVWQKIEDIVKVPVLSQNQLVLHKALKTLGKPTDHLLIDKYLK